MAGYKVYLGMNGKDYKKIIKQKPSIAVIEFTEFSNYQIGRLLESNIKLIAYLNVGAIEKTRPYYNGAKKYVIGNYGDWDEKWMNLSAAAWQSFLINQAILLKKRGAAGLYIDNLDVVEEFPKYKLFDSARLILSEIRKKTGLYLIVNGADYFVSKCVMEKKICFQAIQQQEVFTRITNIDKDKCGSQKTAEKKRLKKYVVAVRKSGVAVFLLEYKPSAANKAKIKSFCKKYGLSYYNAKNVNLDK